MRRNYYGRVKDCAGRCVFVFCAVVVTVLAVSCSSMSRGGDSGYAGPSRVLSDNSLVYVRVPVKNHQKLVTDAIECMSPADESQVAQVVKRLDNIYLGYGSAGDPLRLEVAVRGNIPKIAFSGWVRQSYVSSSGTKYPYYLSDNSFFEVCYIKKDILCAASKTYPLVQNYEKNIGKEWDKGYLWWLEQQSDDILFYVTKKQSWLNDALGLMIPINYQYAYGRLIADDGGDRNRGKYNLDINFGFADERVVKNLEWALVPVAKLTGIQVKAVDSLTLNISRIAIEESSILDLIK